MTRPLKDQRYSIAQELCGQPTPRWVVRFCGDWVGQRLFYSSAIVLAVSHQAQRQGALTIEGQPA